MRYFIFFFICLCNLVAHGQALRRISGSVFSAESKEPIAGATVTVQHSKIAAVTNSNGLFTINISKGEIISITHAEYEKLNLLSDTLQGLNQSFYLVNKSVLLNNVVINTGYEKIDQQKATGSYVKIESGLFNRSTGTSVLSRLDGIASSLYFDHRQGSDAPIQIRGISSIGYASTAPLIILDNFPYEGDINNINPNDVESITILKDAAASSIWGARAGNGVIVITTKKGRFNQPFHLSFNTDVIVTPKPDLFSEKKMSTSDYIDLEQFLFNKGYYNSNINNTRSFPPLSPVVDILVKEKAGILSEPDAEAQLNAMRNLDVRSGFEKYLYKQGVTQQYGINISGGGKNYSYMLSGGYDKNISVLMGNKDDRYTFLSNSTFVPLKNLELDVSLGYTKTNTIANSPGEYGNITILKTGVLLYPYTKLVDASGNLLPINYFYSGNFTDTAGGGKLLDWAYNPIDELHNVNRATVSNALIANAGLKYSLSKSLAAEVKYQYQFTNSNSSNVYNINSFQSRNLINEFTQINGSDVTYIVPFGGILDADQNQLNGYSLRGQLDFNKTIDSKNVITTIAGAEMRQLSTTGSEYRTYGYDGKLNFTNVDYVNAYPTFDNVAGNAIIPSANGFSDLLDRFTSLYFNSSYTYNKAYTLSASFRKDASNLFGVKANQKGIPLWSTGAAWIISEENFYHSRVLPFLKLRATYGYSGNVSNSVSALTTLTYNPASYQPITNVPYATISNYPNPNLQWEKVRMVNIGLDFQAANNCISGSLEYYKKRSTDVLGAEDLDPTVGATFITANSADLDGHGIDIIINSRNISRKNILWETNFLFSSVKNRVTKYLADIYTKGYTSDGAFISPLPGFEPFSIVSFKFAGLDSAGNPQGFVNGKISKDYNALFQNSLEDQVISGPAIPQFFGSIRNTLIWKKLSFSFNITYRLGYYFRKPSLDYYTLFKYGRGAAEYEDRWQKPGDENITNVPSLVYPVSIKREGFYGESDITVAKADNIKLMDIRMGYQFSLLALRKIAIGNVEAFAYLSNPNILIWTANKEGIDPDFPTGLKTPLNISFGLKTGF